MVQREPLLKIELNICVNASKKRIITIKKEVNICVMLQSPTSTNMRILAYSSTILQILRY